MSKEINGYKLFRNEDDAIYISKSKGFLLAFYIDLIGIDEVNYIHGDTSKFLDELTEIELDSEYANKEFTCFDGNDGTITTSLYKDYAEWAEKDQGTQILFDLSGS